MVLIYLFFFSDKKKKKKPPYNTMGFKTSIKYHRFKNFHKITCRLKYPSTPFSTIFNDPSHLSLPPTLLSKIGLMVVTDIPSKKSQFKHTYVYYIKGEEKLNKIQYSSYSSISSSITLLPQLGSQATIT